MIILAGGCVLFGEAMPPKKLAGVVLGMSGILWCARSNTPSMSPDRMARPPDQIHYIPGVGAHAMMKNAMARCNAAYHAHKSLTFSLVPMLSQDANALKRLLVKAYAATMVWQWYGCPMP